MLDEEQIAQLRGIKLVAASDEEVGPIEEVYTHSWDDRPALVAVTLEDGSVLVPVSAYDVEDDRLVVDYEASVITNAPSPGTDTLTEEDFEAVYEHYGISDATMREDSGAYRVGEQPSGDPRTEDAADDAKQGHP